MDDDETAQQTAFAPSTSQNPSGVSPPPEGFLAFHREVEAVDGSFAKGAAMAVREEMYWRLVRWIVRPG